jgi:hypothetical protein
MRRAPTYDAGLARGRIVRIAVTFVRGVALLLCVSACGCGALAAPGVASASASSTRYPIAAPTAASVLPPASSESLQSAAAKASQIGRAVAMSLIALALAVAGTVLAFRRDFKEAAGVFVVGVVAVLLATPSGMNLIRATVASLFGAG